jgi:hypothetical protein
MEVALRIVCRGFIALWFLSRLTGCDECRGRLIADVHGSFSDLAVLGQALYPSHPARADYGGYIVWEGGFTWDCQLTMVRSPKDIKDTCWGVMHIEILPPYCQEPTSAMACAHAKMYQFIAGPKRKGEVYQVQHTTARFEPLPTADPPGVHIGWREYGWGFPDYQSVSVTGTAEVLSEKPFRLAYDVVFLDEADNRREVTVLFEPSYATYCDGE